MTIAAIEANRARALRVGGLAFPFTFSDICSASPLNARHATVSDHTAQDCLRRRSRLSLVFAFSCTRHSKKSFPSVQHRHVRFERFGGGRMRRCADRPLARHRRFTYRGGKLVLLAPRERKIVYAEDDAMLRVAVADMLMSAGITVYGCNDGLEAVELCCEIKPDAALFDLDMPRLDGFEAARRLRRHPGLLGMRIIAITGRASLSYRMRAVDSHFDQFLCKPVALEPLLDALHMTADGNRRNRMTNVLGVPARSARGSN